MLAASASLLHREAEGTARRHGVLTVNTVDPSATADSAVTDGTPAAQTGRRRAAANQKCLVTIAKFIIFF